MIKLDGVTYRLEAPDVDRDGKSGGVETLRQSFNNVVPINQPTELGEAMKHLNRDEIDPNTRMTSIDMGTRIYNSFERNALNQIDSLVAMRFLPVSVLAVTRQHKRLNVSMKGEGRKENVELVVGKREHDKQSSAGGMFSGLMGGGKKE